jgi:hypothetical protein
MAPQRRAWPCVFCLLLGLASACGSAESVAPDAPPEPSCTPLVEDTLVPLEPPPDGAAACASGVCNYQTQAGCAVDQACRPQFNATEPKVNPGCERAGAGASGDSCAAQTDCARGFYCALGACHKLCCGGDFSACDSGESCIRNLQVRAGGEVLSAGADLCFPVGTCDPLDPNSCADEPNRECKIVDANGAVACAPRSSAGKGDACAPPTVCRQGLNCVGGYCIRLCAYAMCAEPSCEADESCVHFARDPEGLGECTLGR